MKKLTVLFALLITVLFSFTVIAQKISMIGKGFAIPSLKNIQRLVLDPLPTGTYTVGVGGYFPTIDSAFNKLSIDGVAGEVIIELTDNLYIAPTDTFGFFLNGPIPGAGQNNRVKIKPAENENVIIEGSGLATVTLLNTNYLTIDGVALTGSTTLTIHTLSNNSFSYNDGIDFINNSDHNIMQNVVFINEDGGRGSGSGFGSEGSALAPDSNLIQFNYVKQSGVALYAYGNPAHIANGNIFRGNIIGTETDSLIAFGIIVSTSQNTIIENNIIQNIKLANSWDASNAGIYSFYDSGDIIRNNIVHNIKSSSGYSSVGIFLSAEPAYIGSNNLVYNNMVYDIQSTSIENNSRVAGIQIRYQYSPKIYYNSVYLSGTGANHQGSAALFINNNCANVDAKNNIFVNTRDESPYCASAIYDYSTSNLTTNFNDLFYQLNQYNCLVKIGNTNYNTLTDWQVTGQDSNSINEMPNFVSPDLHIYSTIYTLLDKHATPIAGITTDIDNNPRNLLTPDIGADEFDFITGIEEKITPLIEFALEQNYPNPFNPSTMIKYQIPDLSFATLKVFDVLGNEIAILVNEEKPGGTYEITWNADNLPSGVYFYQLKAGEYTAVKKMLLIK